MNSDVSPTTDEPILPRLLASNALRANLEKHMTLNKMADAKASMVMTASSLIITVALAQFENLALLTIVVLVTAGLISILLSILAIIPPWHVTDKTNLFYFRSFAELTEDEFVAVFKETIASREKLYDAYLHEIYYLGKFRLTRKYALLRNGMVVLLIGLLLAAMASLGGKLF
ncbi:MAG: DUF5706 domain-containing protein [Desulfuromonadales bacterium]|nr:DUF5706 domain-containing protein [Desulfuromonadales bacterium]MDT8423713.1 DUF5706 domain-containing protein [Desulfuromonadales bacterium]